MTPIRVGVIGIGGVGGRVLEGFGMHEQTQVTAVCDLNPDLAKRVAEEHGAAAWYTDYREMLRGSELDLVYIAVPPKLHHRMAMDVLERGLHLFCEKPLANSVEEAQEMWEAAERAGVVHAMNFPTPYRSVWSEFSRLVEEGHLGELRRLDVTLQFHTWPRKWQQNPWIAGREQGGFVREVLPHYIQLIQHRFGRIARVHSEMTYGDDPNLCETAVLATFELDNGVRVLVDGQSNIAQKERIAFTAYGTEGTMQLADWSILRTGGVDEALETVPVPENNRHLGLIEDLVQAIDGKPAMLFDFRIGYEVQRVLEAVLSGGTHEL
ncbi:Gfo/Idh/MocA family oxidoreductase [Tumebacillus sp. ITR2]|uniref:Gfo/Idh/MocA family oxidoreductase n=1 Tax=Tumebacillus amylolyticus TaxID=2801339 RepID=A0ABS1JAW2_9BACL|nr:Gfo/Idh/MocA family oxidoreductase [Tumebacillus amylolyticus]